MTITYHPTFKKCGAGFVPMVTLRGAKGRMIGSRVGANNVFTSQEAAISAAHSAALRAVEMAQGCARVA